MATMKNGILGGITGKLGNLVYYIVDGQQRVRVNEKSTKPRTEKQLLSQAEMRIVNQFLQPVKTLINIGYGIEAKKSGRQPYNMALSFIKKHALKSIGAERQIDYGKVQLSTGNLPNLDEVTAVRDEGGLSISWSPSYAGSASGSDRVMLLAYFAPVESRTSAVTVCSFGDARRLDGEYILRLPVTLSGQAVEVYAFVQAANAKSVSNTRYVGRFSAE